jgi:hypothetical protein
LLFPSNEKEREGKRKRGLLANVPKAVVQVTFGSLSERTETDF